MRCEGVWGVWRVGMSGNETLLCQLHQMVGLGERVPVQLKLTTASRVKRRINRLLFRANL